MNLILISMGVLGVTALVAAILLYFVSQFFKVEEDPRIDLVQAVLPGANCGGCGFAGCRNFAEACVEEAAPAAQTGDKKGFDPAIAAKIKTLTTPRAAFPLNIAMAQKS